MAVFLYSPVWITTILLSPRFPSPLCLGWESELLYPTNGSQLEIYLVNAAVPVLPSIPCDVSPVFLDLPAVMCRTRYTCLGRRRSDRASALLISVVLGWQIRATPSMTAVISYSFKNVLCEYASEKFPIRALGLKGGWKYREEFWEIWDIYKEGLDCVSSCVFLLLFARSSIAIKISINGAISHLKNSSSEIGIIGMIVPKPQTR